MALIPFLCASDPNYKLLRLKGMLQRRQNKILFFRRKKPDTPLPNLQAKTKPFSVCNRRCWRKNHRQLSRLTARYFQLSISSTTLITSLLQTCNFRPLQQLLARFSILCLQNLPRNVFGHDRFQRSFHARLGYWPWRRKRRKRVVDLLLI